MSEHGRRWWRWRKWSGSRNIHIMIWRRNIDCSRSRNILSRSYNLSIWSVCWNKRCLIHHWRESRLSSMINTRSKNRWWHGRRYSLIQSIVTINDIVKIYPSKILSSTSDIQVAITFDRFFCRIAISSRSEIVHHLFPGLRPSKNFYAAYECEYHDYKCNYSSENTISNVISYVPHVPNSILNIFAHIVYLLFDSFTKSNASNGTRNANICQLSATIINAIIIGGTFTTSA